MNRHGTRSIFQDASKQQKLFWLYAEDSGKPTLAWSSYLRGLKRKASHGRLKQSPNMHRNGSRKSTGEPMQSYHARGFLTLLLSPNQRKQIWETEALYPDGRYLTGSEICKLLNLEKPEPIEQTRLDAMEDCYQRWHKTRRTESSSFEGLSDHAAWKDWMTWVDAMYSEPLPTATVDPWGSQ